MVLRRIRRRSQGDDGLALVLTSLCLVAVLAVAAIVIDLGNARQVARESQGGTDAAALAGAHDLPRPGDPNQPTMALTARNVALTNASHNLGGPSATAPTACSSGDGTTCTRSVRGVDVAITTPVNGIINLIKVEMCQANPTFFAGVINRSTPRVCRSAIGRRTVGTGDFDWGLIAMHPTACPGFSIGGNGVTNVSLTASVMVNSSCASGAMVDQGVSWELNTGFIGVVGAEGVACDAGSTRMCIDRPIVQVPSFTDPVKAVYPTEPAQPGVSPTANCNGPILEPGYYAGNCRITSSNNDIQMRPGIYYFNSGFDFRGGSLTCVDASPTVTCANTGVMLFVKAGDLNLNGNGVMTLPGYSAGAYGSLPISVWQKSTNTNMASLNGTNGSILGGTVYVPGGELRINGNGAFGVTGLVLGNTVDLRGSMNFTITVPRTTENIPTEDEVILED